MRTMKNFFSLIKTLFNACVKYPVDGILVVLSIMWCIEGIITDNSEFAFVATVLAMHSIYSAYRLNSKVIK